MEKLSTRLAVAATLAGSACAPFAEPIDDPSGLWSTTRVVEELRIGVDAGPRELMFGSVHQLAAAGDGTMFVANGAPVGVRVFDRHGNYVNDIGREGQGPGEYQRINGINVLPNGMVAIWDVGNRRVSLFRQDGEYLGGFAADSSSWSGRGDFEYDGDGNVYVRGSLRVPLEPGSEEARAAAAGPQPVGASGPVAIRPVYFKYSIEGEALGEVPLPAPRPSPVRSFTLSRDYPARPLDPFRVVTYFVWSPSGYLAVGRNDTYRVELQVSGGSVLLTRDIDPISLGSEEHAEWATWNDYARALSIERGGPMDFPPIPATKPYFRGMYAGDAGRIWVERYVAAEKVDVPSRPPGDERPQLTWLEPPTYDVFEPDGTFLGTVVLPRDTRLLACRDELVWAAHIDEAGVERIIRLRVEPAAR